MYNLQLERMPAKLMNLRNLDPDLELFGVENHEYEMAPVWKQEDIAQFEQKWQIELPGEYKAWLLHMGTGGVGPYYGLENPDDGVYAVLGYDDELNAISDPFQFTEAWNWNYEWFDDSKEEEEWEALEHEYFDPKWSAGMLRISDYGCGISINLIVKGASYGEIWVDDRANQTGIHPYQYLGNTNRLRFLDWYELWLDRSIHEMHKQKQSAGENGA